MPSVLAIHGVCTVLWVGSPWDPKYLLLLTFTTLNVLSDRDGKFRLHKSRDAKNQYLPFPHFFAQIDSSGMSPSIHSLWLHRNVPPSNYRHLESVIF